MAAGRLEATNEATNVKIASVANGTRYPATATKRSYLDNQIPKGGERERERQNERKEEGKKENWHHVPSAAAETRLQWPLWLLIKRVFFTVRPWVCAAIYLPGFYRPSTLLVPLQIGGHWPGMAWRRGNRRVFGGPASFVYSNGMSASASPLDNDAVRRRRRRRRRQRRRRQRRRRQRRRRQRRASGYF